MTSTTSGAQARSSALEAAERELMKNSMLSTVTIYPATCADIRGIFCSTSCGKNLARSLVDHPVCRINAGAIDIEDASVHTLSDNDGPRVIQATTMNIPSHGGALSKVAV